MIESNLRELTKPVKLFAIFGQASPPLYSGSWGHPLIATFFLHFRFIFSTQSQYRKNPHRSLDRSGHFVDTLSQDVGVQALACGPSKQPEGWTPMPTGLSL
jgi:hypothetical protein